MAAKLLLTSIHDVTPRFEYQIEQLIAAIHKATGSPQFAMLVVPDHWDQAPIAADKGFQRKLRAWADTGIEMFVHGWRHRDDAPKGFKGKHMTAGEGEFLALDTAEATRRMRDGRALIEDIIGQPTAGFIAPAWLYGDGARAALHTLNLPLAEDHFRVWRPSDEATLATGPVISWASRSRARIASALAFARIARIALKPQRVVRVALHPGDTTAPALMTSIDLTLGSFMQSHAPGKYQNLQQFHLRCC